MFLVHSRIFITSIGRERAGNIVLIVLNCTANRGPKFLSFWTLRVRLCQHQVSDIKMFVCMSSLRIQLMTSWQLSTNRVLALGTITPLNKDHLIFLYRRLEQMFIFLRKTKI